jgi:hypothetical protein
MTTITLGKMAAMGSDPGYRPGGGGAGGINTAEVYYQIGSYCFIVIVVVVVIVIVVVVIVIVIILCISLLNLYG